MSFDFDVEPLYDAAVAEAGVDFRVEKNGKYYGTFKMRHFDELSTAGELATKRLKAQYAKEIRTKSLTEWQSIAVTLSNLYLIGWEGIKAKGKPVEFSVEAAIEYFSREDTRWIAVELIKFATDSANFASDEEFEARDISKN